MTAADALAALQARIGEDVHPGDVVVTEGTVLTPAHIGVLASVGREGVTVRRPPRVGLRWPSAAGNKRRSSASRAWRLSNWRGKLPG